MRREAEEDWGPTRAHRLSRKRYFRLPVSSPGARKRLSGRPYGRFFYPFCRLANSLPAASDAARKFDKAACKDLDRLNLE